MGRTSKTNRDFEVKCSLHGTTNVSGNYPVDSCLRCNAEGTKGKIQIRELKERYFIVECSLHGSYKASGNSKIESCLKCDYERPISRGKIQIVELGQEEWDHGSNPKKTK